MPEDVIAQAEAVAKSSDKSKALSAARQAATTRLIDAHRDEFNGYMTEEATARNVEWKRKMTPAERAEKELADLVKANPALAEILRQQYGSPDPATTGNGTPSVPQQRG